MAERLNPVPPGWGDDPLSAFFDAARSNAFASFHLFAAERGHVIKLDGVYLAAFANLKDPEDPLGAALAFRCHSALRAAAQLALSGQIPECMAVLRLALEIALYAHHASTSDARSQNWLNREDSKESKKENVREFTPRIMLPELRLRDQRTGDIAGQLYDRMIDYGAHPNVRGVLGSMTHEEGEEVDTFAFAYLNGDALPLKFGIKSWCQVAVCCLDIFALVFPERFASVGVASLLAPLRVGL